MATPCTPVYGAGHPNLDRDHEILLRIRHDLGAAAAQPARWQALCLELLAYLDAHCEHEEQLMARYHYPGAEAHRNDHTAARQHLQSLVGSTPESGELVAAMDNWIHSHMRNVDARFAEFLSLLDVPPPEDPGGSF
jgi:hemerythrin-like metal-binding protein